MLFGISSFSSLTRIGKYTMKKILFVILLFISFNVNAKEISFEEVANNYIKKYLIHDQLQL